MFKAEKYIEQLNKHSSQKFSKQALSYISEQNKRVIELRQNDGNVEIIKGNDTFEYLGADIP